MTYQRLNPIEAVDEYVGHRVRLRRKERDESQQSLAEACGVTFQQIQKYERGANRISASMLVKIATHLGVPPGYFLDAAPGALEATQQAEERPSEGLRLIATTPGAVEALRSLHAMRPNRRAHAVSILKCLADRDPA